MIKHTPAGNESVTKCREKRKKESRQTEKWRQTDKQMDEHADDVQTR